MKNLAAPELSRYRVPHPMEAHLGPMPDWMRAWVGSFLVAHTGRPPRRGLAFTRTIKVIASRAGGPAELYGPGGNWDHASVSIKGSEECPTWSEMSFIKQLFFERDEPAMQLHPVREYVNNHPGCLHLWRPTDVDIPLPPSILVGLPEWNVA